MRSNTWLWILAIAMLGALAWGLEQVAFTPLQTGEVYPPFSSLRADPLGAKALYESLAALPDIQVDRLYKRRQKLDSPQDAMLGNHVRCLKQRSGEHQFPMHRDALAFKADDIEPARVVDQR